MLATRFNKRAPVIQASHGFLTEDQIRAIVPSIFAEEAHGSRSARYTYIPTIEVVRGLGREGFKPTFACQAKPRDEGKFDHTKHMIRFRREADALAGEAKELIMVNSHDGTTSYQLLAGMFRFVCKNGLIVGDKFAEVRVQHKGDIVRDVIEGAYEVVKDFAQVESDMNEMKAIELKPAEALIMAETAAEFRFEIDDYRDSPVEPRRFLQPKRYDDNANDLWSTFNRIQENAIRGGLRGETRDANGRRRAMTSREVRGIDQNVHLNRMLWRMAQLMADSKTGRATPEMMAA